jgi:ABC-2 type transport system ATP-binding protein
MYEDIVAFAELKEFMDQKLKNYSSGMQVRLAFSMAIRADADVLLIDEVLAVGDADFQRKCFEYFKDLKKRHKTVVFVSHDMNAIQDYCDRALLIEGHKALRLDHPGVIAQDYIRLFESEKPKQSRSASKSERWGSRRASILNLSCSVRNDSVSIEYDVVAKDDLEEIVAGFRIRNASGEAIIGTNTKREKQPIKEINKGQIIHVSWSFPNILSTDKYYVDPALVESDEITVLDWWNEAAVFHINKRQGFSFIVDPEIDLKLSKK